MFNGKMKAVTFSYDDGVVQDKRLIELLGKYELKATFNLNSGLLGTSGKLAPEEVRAVYAGHEIAGHTLTHPMLPQCTDEEIIRQVEEDRCRLSELAGYSVIGMAYPGGGINNTPHVRDVVRQHTGMCFARTITSSHNFDLQDDLLSFKPTVYHLKEGDTVFRLAEKFLETAPERAQLFYIWGHSYEFDRDQSWEAMEELCKLLGNRPDVFYGTNREVFGLCK